MKQTVVEWLEKELIKHGSGAVRTFGDLFEQAKEMEKQQIIEAHGSKLKNSKGATNYEYWYTGEMYYNENFKSE